MLTAWSVEEGHCHAQDGVATAEALRHAVWIDLLNPTPGEEKAVQDALRLEIPTREEMQEIESSSRLYKEGEALFLTANFVHGIDTGELNSTAITFVLGASALITVRYATPKAFAVFAARAQRQPALLLATPDAVMLHLFEQVVDRIADILEKVGADMDRSSKSAFRTARGNAKANKRDLDLRGALIALGEVGEVTSRANETLVGLARILSFVQAEKALAVRKENQPLVKGLVQDVRSLIEHANFLANKAQFLLDAVLGLINIDQNGIIKTFTVASVALMPPTLIASIYGMNFKFMPELDWSFGYPIALGLMVVSGLLPIFYFKRKGWL